MLSYRTFRQSVWLTFPPIAANLMFRNGQNVIRAWTDERRRRDHRGQVPHLLVTDEREGGMRGEHLRQSDGFLVERMRPAGRPFRPAAACASGVSRERFLFLLR
jgi:hypothetical protein